jgi:hypothetical protein
MANPGRHPADDLGEWMEAHGQMTAVALAKLLDARPASEQRRAPEKTKPSPAAISLWLAKKAIPDADNRDAIAALTGIPSDAWRSPRVRAHLARLASVAPSLPPKSAA